MEFPQGIEHQLIYFGVIDAKERWIMVQHPVVKFVCGELGAVKYLYKQQIVGIRQVTRKQFKDVSEQDIKDSVQKAIDIVFNSK